MGYRSQIECLIYGPADNMSALVARLSLEGFHALTTESVRDSLTRWDAEIDVNPTAVDDAEGLVKQMWSFNRLSSNGDKAWKWYDGYTDVDAWMAMLGHLDEIAEDAGVNYEFQRVGEDHLDTDNRQAGPDVYGYLWYEMRIAVSDDLPQPPEVSDGPAT